MLFALSQLLCAAALAAAPAPVVQLQIDGAIGPASADYAIRGLGHAQELGAQLVVITIDTPGGLDSSMRDIIKAILASPLPVASYVAPSGARAASAGTYILYASHIAAMAPGTNLGAATPVELGGPPGTPAPPGDEPSQPGPEESGKPAPAASDSLSKKQVNDAAAYIRSLAQLRGRNAEWAEQAVREAVSLAAGEALKLNVINYVASDLHDLLKQLDGKRIATASGEIRLQPSTAMLINLEPDWRTRLLTVITNPSVALLLMTIGIYGLILEFANPGSLVGGVLGGICLLVGLYALQLLPLNYAGMVLIMLGFAFIAAEAFLPSFGILGIGGVLSFGIGALILIDTEVPNFGIPLPLIISLATFSGLLVFAIVSMALRARRQQLVGGDQELIGSLARIEAVQTDDPLRGWLSLQGERWQVISQAPLQPGAAVRVLARQGLLLEVAVSQTAVTRENDHEH
ncbi:NfeD family protein [Pseudomonas pohangensis]|nr:nodulation protein NfeD [Pseudomonas pohangensis]